MPEFFTANSEYGKIIGDITKDVMKELKNGTVVKGGYWVAVFRDTGPAIVIISDLPGHEKYYGALLINPTDITESCYGYWAKIIQDKTNLDWEGIKKSVIDTKQNLLNTLRKIGIHDDFYKASIFPTTTLIEILGKRGANISFEIREFYNKVQNMNLPPFVPAMGVVGTPINIGGNTRTAYITSYIRSILNNWLLVTAEAHIGQVVRSCLATLEALGVRIIGGITGATGKIPLTVKVLGYLLISPDTERKFDGWKETYTAAVTGQSPFFKNTLVGIIYSKQDLGNISLGKAASAKTFFEKVTGEAPKEYSTRNLDISGIPYVRSVIGSLASFNYSKTGVPEIFKEIVNEVRTKEGINITIVYLVGPTGAGKTALGAAALGYMLQQLGAKNLKVVKY